MGRPVRVLWVIKGLGVGGAEQLLAQAARRLDRDRFACEAVYFLPWKDALAGELREQGVEVACLNFVRPFDPRSVTRLAGMLVERRIDLVHAHLPYSGVVARLAARKAGVPCIYTEHNVQSRYHALTRLANQSTMRLCARTIAVSEEVRASLERSRLARGARLRTIVNGVDVDALAAAASQGAGVREEFNIPADRLVVGVVNVFRPQKRLDLWVRAARAIADAEPRAFFLVVGEGPGRPEIEALAARLGLDGRIVFTGLRRDAPRLMAAFDVFMLSSVFEGLPVAVLEAMALGRPIVATRVGGVPSAVEDGVQGRLVPPADPAALGEAVIALLRSAERRAAWGDAGRERVRRAFSIDHMVRETERLYGEVLWEAGRPAPSEGREPRVMA